MSRPATNLTQYENYDKRRAEPALALVEIDQTPADSTFRVAWEGGRPGTEREVEAAGTCSNTQTEKNDIGRE